VIVVSDTSPLTSLLIVHQIGLLAELYGSVVVPPAVAGELRRRHSSLPAFIREVPLHDRSRAARLSEQLDAGEAEAIALAVELKADVLLIDELEGRLVARREGIPIVGLLGILVQAKRRGLIQAVGPVMSQLEREAAFYIAAGLRVEILKMVGEA
jgi:predicted nucleic acid-binding protein